MENAKGDEVMENSLKVQESLLDAIALHRREDCRRSLAPVSLETLMKFQTPLWAEQHKALGVDWHKHVHLT